MAATLMTLVQAALLPRDTDTKPSEGATSHAPWAEKPRGAVQAALPAALQQLVTAATEIARVDKMVLAARAEAPTEDDPEAQRWHEVSVRALEWSRAALEKQQHKALQDVKAELYPQAVASSPPAALAPAPLSPALAPATAPLLALPPVTSPASQPEVEPDVDVQGEEPVGRAHHPQVGSLRADLECLRQCDPGVCIIVRQIKRLGLESQDLLQEHFSRLGRVRRVLVAHSFEKPSAKRRHGRVRPAALGFLVMETPEEADAVVAAGHEHQIRDVDVSVQVFQAFSDLASLERETR